MQGLISILEIFEWIDRSESTVIYPLNTRIQPVMIMYLTPYLFYPYTQSRIKRYWIR